MLYLLTIESIRENNPSYTMFEAYTESVITGDSACVRKLVNRCRMKPVNMTVVQGRVQIKQRSHDAQKLFIKNHTYILLAKITEEKFKLVRFDGAVVYMSAIVLKDNIDSNNIVNCSVEDGAYKSKDTYNASIDSDFAQYIDRKYAEFIAKSLIVGLHTSFDYTIENKEVKLMNYTGSRGKVILPNFITTINKEAFRGKHIDELILNKGLKYIGDKAFAYNTISHVEIPENVEFVGYNAFAGNNKLISITGGFNEAVKKLSNNTILL